MNILSAAAILGAGLLFPTLALPAATGSDATASPLQVDCARRALPRQRQVGALVGQDNFSQIYASRARLMAEVGRACRDPAVRQVRLVREGKPLRGDPGTRRLVLNGDPSR